MIRNLSVQKAGLSVKHLPTRSFQVLYIKHKKHVSYIKIIKKRECRTTNRRGREMENSKSRENTNGIVPN